MAEKGGFAHAISGKAVAKSGFADEKGEFAAAEAGFAEENLVLANEKPNLAEEKPNLAKGKPTLAKDILGLAKGNSASAEEKLRFPLGKFGLPKGFWVFRLENRLLPGQIASYPISASGKRSRMDFLTRSSSSGRERRRLMRR